MIKCLRVLFFAALFVAASAQAEKEPTPGPVDTRVRTVTYNERDVVVLRGAYGYSMIVRFANDEDVQDIAIGDKVAWRVSKAGDGHGIYLKPVEENANTNLIVRTTKRLYNFSLVGLKVSSANDPALTNAVYFSYPQDEAEVKAAQDARSAQIVSATVRPEDFNFNYTWSGSPDRKPLRVFDDGKFTYFQFADTSRLPAIFVVDVDGNEAIVNWHQRGPYVVVERIDRQFTLRDGDISTCVFNEAMGKPGKPSRKRKPL